MAELKWLEDLLVLIEEGSFTHAAQRRHVTQPAFSRRIGLLEEWLGVAIVDRRRKPIGVLPEFREREAEVRDLVHRFYQLRNELQAESISQQRVVFVAQHTLAISRFPALIQRIKSVLPGTRYRIQPENNEDCEAVFLKEAHFMLCYDLPNRLLLWSDEIVSRQALGVDRLIPVVGGDLLNDFQGEFQDGIKPASLPLLLFPKGSFFADVLAGSCLPGVLRDYRVEVICESAFAISLKEMVLAGMGIAWLPEGLVQQDIQAGRMKSLEALLGECALQVSLYYQRGSGADEVFAAIVG